ncbi:MAG TPA: triose-phosphate isomerase [bacterium]|nr:triose-phosphate isomerase [bacterium]HQG45560.1 triose-phosphate isomerase [bacterium]HQI48115.1 triose-phosphate isomerase [bacterium]HQJ64511.1 triose-phosphate isomerase [bacterium]
MRKRIIAGNWKMNKDVAGAAELARAVVAALTVPTETEIVLCPPFTDLTTVAAVIQGTPIRLGGQNMHWEEKGAFTGEVSAAMLLSAGCSHVILGHSERRQYFGETDETVNHKVRAALKAGLIPIVCVGETLAERQTEETAAVVARQIRGALAGLSGEEVARLVIAYEPVWAIGTGVVATSDQAQEVHALIRQLVARLYDSRIAEVLRIQYGGSMKPDNAAQLLAQKDIDGGLIGGASLDARSFVEIVYA